MYTSALNSVTLTIQLNGDVRATLKLPEEKPAPTPRDSVSARVAASEAGAKPLLKVVVVPNASVDIEA